MKNHVFFQEHPIPNYEGGVDLRRYDSDHDMAEAWLRLRSGRPLPEDLTLLEHELAESRYYEGNPGADYRAAHNAANQVANCENRVLEPTYEDFDRE